MYITFSKGCAVNLVEIFPDNSKMMDQRDLIIEEHIEDRILANYSIKKLFSIFRNPYWF